MTLRSRQLHEGLLTGGNRAALPRQQTLAATIEWSYNLLSPAERALFDRLAVFAGGFALHAVETICGDSHPGKPFLEASDRRTDSLMEATNTLDLLSHLVEKSLVVTEVGSAGVERYRLLETLRQYAREG